ncbi:hypothetical protein [Streptomyces melanogenes]|uniref:GNAT family N-acetyltransferase n=1 Tax=Streptomyces melanogenes TaxID=67326 RepID=A0ABZ1XP01_9ACTN|nr:hypothetical protein [Streptomyces melanogenes]
MAPVPVTIAPFRPIESHEEPALIELVEDLDAFAQTSLPGCGDDNPYN